MTPAAPASPCGDHGGSAGHLAGAGAIVAPGAFRPRRRGPRPRLSGDLLLEAGRRYQAGERVRTLAADFGVCHSTLWRALARAYDGAAHSESEQIVARLVTPIAKYWICKRTPAFVAEALECEGGNGYIEDGVMPRLYREAPLNGIWEGTGNLVCLDVLRVLATPHAFEAFVNEVTAAAGGDPRLDAFLLRLEGDMGKEAGNEARARRTVEMMALALQASLLVRHSTKEVADAFVASRLGGETGRAFGTLSGNLAQGTIVKRALLTE